MMKKREKTWIALLLVLCLMLSVLPAAFAEEDAPEGDERFEGKTWEQVTADYVAACGASEDKVSIGYYNTVTGEEYYYAGERYRDAGSMFKVPLNMVFCERVAAGELDWDTYVRGYTYQYLLRSTIIDSNNESAKLLWLEIGKTEVRPYPFYRRTIAPYMGVDPDNVDEKYYENNFFTAEQMICCLKLLYENPDRFPGLVDVMKEAERSKYFLQHEQPVEIAHKYGLNYINDGRTLVLNDCGIIYTEDPFCLVVFTEDLGNTAFNQYAFLPNYCTLMIDYTEYQTRLRHEREEQERLEEELRAAAEEAGEKALPAALTTEGTPAAEESSSQTAGAAEEKTEESASGGSRVWPTLLVILLCIGAGAALIRLSQKRQLRIVWALPALLLFAAALLLCVYAPQMKTKVSGLVSTDSEGALQLKEDPKDSVESFFEALTEGNYKKAYRYLNDYASLGLENEPKTEGARRLAEALRRSYSYTLLGESEIDENNIIFARQRVQLRVLDLTALSGDLKPATEAALEAMISGMPERETVDEDGNYLPELTEQAYLTALEEILGHSDKYMKDTELELTLFYTAADGWRIMTDAKLIDALSGFASGKGGRPA